MNKTISPHPLGVTPPPTDTQDPLLYRILISGLVSAVILTVLATAILAGFARTVPEGLIAIGSACVGGLVGLLVPSPVR